MTDKLKPCPFCGRADNPAPKSRQIGCYSVIECSRCSAHGPLLSTLDGAVTAWNTRPFVLAEPPAVLPSEDESATDHALLDPEACKQAMHNAAVKVAEALLSATTVAAAVAVSERERRGGKA